ncbi:MAG: hypothetical protein QOE66_56, partial [Chloroflexota bacterium]|nr:hypothetical protein [Chloroflexota bacterium]
DIEIRSYYASYPGDVNRFWSDLCAAMDEGGAYAVCFKGQEIERLLQAGVPPDKLRRWEIVRYGNAPAAVAFADSVVVYRRKRPADEPAARPLEPAPLAAAKGVERR